MEQINWSFEGPIEGFVVNFLKKNFWRIKSQYEYEDALQEARLTFVVMIRRLEKNGNSIENEKHLMSLFKTTWIRHFHTLSLRDTKKRVESPMSEIYVTDDDESSVINLDSMVGTEYNTGYLEILIEQAPKEVKQVLNLLFNAPKEIIELATQSWTSNNRKNALIGNAFLCKMLGYDCTKVDLVGQVKHYLLED